jgi:hypothetical protein
MNTSAPATVAPGIGRRLAGLVFKAEHPPWILFNLGRRSVTVVFTPP